MGRRARWCRTQAERGPPERVARSAHRSRCALSGPCHAARRLTRPFPPLRTVSGSNSARASRGNQRALPRSRVQHSKGSSAPVGGSEWADGVRAWCARAGHPDRPPREQIARPTGVGVGRPLPCPAASNASRGAERARVRPQQLPEACSRRARARSVFVGALVSGMEDASHRGFGPASRRASHDVAGAGGMAERRAPPDQRIAHGPRAGQAPIGSSLRLMSTARAECVSSPIAT